MSVTKEEIINKLEEFELINDENREQFNSLNKPYLEEVLKTYENREKLIESLGQSEADLKDVQEKLSVQLKINEELKQKLGEKTEVKKEVIPGLKFTFRGVKYKFRDDAPKEIRYGGVSRTQEELTKLEEDDLLQIIYKPSLIEKIKDNG